MEQILTITYGASGIAAAALYIPQILKFRQDRAARRSISLLSWSGWIAIAAVTVLYALYVAKSPLIAMVAGLNALAQSIVLYYGIRERLAQRPTAIPSRRSFGVDGTALPSTQQPR